MRVNLSHIIVFLILLQLNVGLAQDTNTDQEVRFKTSNGFFGKAIIITKPYYDTSFKIDIGLKSVIIEGFETSLGTFSNSKLEAYNIVFPTLCEDCSIILKGSISVLLPDSYSRTYIDFNTDSGLSKNTTTTLTIPLSYNNSITNELISAWISTSAIERTEITNLDGQTLRTIISAARKFAAKKEDADILTTLLHELRETPANERKQLVYNSRNRFSDKSKADSLVKVIENGSFTVNPIVNTSTEIEKKVSPSNLVSKQANNEYRMPDVVNTNSAGNAEEAQYLIEELKERLASEKEICSERILSEENKKDQAVKNEEYLLANEINNSINALKKECVDNLLSFEVEIAQAEKDLKEQKTNKNGQRKVALEKCKKEIQDLETMKSSAITTEDYLAASELKKAIIQQKEKCTALSDPGQAIIDYPNTIPLNIRQEKEPQQKVESQETTLIAVVSSTSKNQNSSKTESNQSSLKTIMNNPNGLSQENSSEDSNSLSELVNETEQTEGLAQIINTKNSTSLAIITEEEDSTPKSKRNLSKISKSDFDFTANLKAYKRSSLATIMLENSNEEHIDVIKETFLNKPLPEKFNNHNVSHKYIPIYSTAKNHSNDISRFLESNQVAKKLVAKWFNRDENGAFNMDLIAKRGHYNATAYDVNIAKNSERGLAMLADAGEQLIGNTFVVVNDYKFTNKEEVGKKVSLLANLTSIAASYAGAGDVATVASAVSLGSAVAGKGYVIKTTSYLYKLVWTGKIAETFYNDYWIDENNFDPTKKTAFDNSQIFRLVLIGYENAWADVQSSIFTNKSEEELIERATIKASDQAISKLQRKFEIFRTKTPLLSADPLTAKIGLKEGLEKGDKFEVLEQYLRDDGTVGLKRKGVIKVDKNYIWDNRYMAHEENNSSLEYTKFNGDTKRLYAGMLIRQIN